MQAAIRGTDWYKSHSASWRQAWVLKRDNPGEFERQKTQAQGTVDAIANEFGVNLTTKQRNQIAHDIVWLGLNDQEVNEAVGALFQATSGDYEGRAGDFQDEIKQMAADYGVRVSDSWIGGVVQSLLTGKGTPQDAQNKVLELARSAYPALAEQLDAGMTVRQIADPYIQAMARTLELPDSDIDIYDTSVRSALQARNKDGTSMMKPLYQFEEDLRKDPRWLQTNNARDTLMGTTAAILRQWGVVS